MVNEIKLILTESDVNAQAEADQIQSLRDDTQGLLMWDHPGERPEFLCFTLEDEHRAVKVKHETRIPEGLYKLKLRKHGGHPQELLGALWQGVAQGHDSDHGCAGLHGHPCALREHG